MVLDVFRGWKARLIPGRWCCPITGRLFDGAVNAFWSYVTPGLRERPTKHALRLALAREVCVDGSARLAQKHFLLEEWPPVGANPNIREPAAPLGVLENRGRFDFAQRGSRRCSGPMIAAAGPGNGAECVWRGPSRVRR